MERDSRKLIRLLERDGWVLDRISGSHHTFKHPDSEEIITIPHPRKDVSIGVARRVYALAGWQK